VLKTNNRKHDFSLKLGAKKHSCPCRWQCYKIENTSGKCSLFYVIMNDINQTKFDKTSSGLHTLDEAAQNAFPATYVNFSDSHVIGPYIYIYIKNYFILILFRHFYAKYFLIHVLKIYRTSATIDKNINHELRRIK
jgi:hypothetical protein